MASIDILIPTYNGEKCITQTLKSILSQDFDDFQIIISDDLSMSIRFFPMFDSRMKTHCEISPR